MDVISNRLMEIHPAIMREFHSIETNFCKGLDLPLIHVKILMSVFHRKNCCLCEISSALNITPAWASEVIDKMVKTGLIRRTASDKDRRKIILSISSDGKKIIKKIKDQTKKYYIKLLSILGSEKNKRKLLEAFEILYDLSEILKNKRISS